MSSPRIIVPCSEDQPERRHRWREREHYMSTLDHRFTEKWCERCGRWYSDVIEHSEEPLNHSRGLAMGFAALPEGATLDES